MCIALLTISIVVLCIGMKFLMISIDVQFIGIKLVMKASIGVHSIAYDKHSCVHWN